MSSVPLMAAVIATGLHTGFLPAFLIAVVPGHAALPDDGSTGTP
ncbi:MULTISPECIES: hypothetical protein [Streptomyces]|uniref:Uncharacterized protein n=1 Tax=Streptomyces flavovirens TaxID=52258 RepID=A0ABV8N577_9ACTN|nr:hypothetical protein [Streptomyces sp. MBT51]